jgi:hypothetical protein
MIMNIAVLSAKVAVSHSLLWVESGVKKFYKDGDRMGSGIGFVNTNMK